MCHHFFFEVIANIFHFFFVVCDSHQILEHYFTLITLPNAWICIFPQNYSIFGWSEYYSSSFLPLYSKHNNLFFLHYALCDLFCLITCLFCFPLFNYILWFLHFHTLSSRFLFLSSSNFLYKMIRNFIQFSIIKVGFTLGNLNGIKFKS